MTDPNFIVIGNGKRFHPFAPDPAQIDLPMLAYALAGVQRWGGHAKPRITVAEHSVRGAALVADRLKFAFSLHDAPEAISGTGDIQGPIKPYVYLWHPTEERLMSVEEYETDILIAIMEAVGCHDISVEDWQTIYAADKLMCATEARDLMPPDPWHAEMSKLPERIIPWTMAKAEAEFLKWAKIWKEMQTS